MTRHVRRALALTLAGALFSAGAWGQATTLRQWVKNPINVASEYFGTADGRELGRDVKGQTTDCANQRCAPVVSITVHGDVNDEGVSPSGELGQGNIAQITYTLSGATFAETVSASNLTGANLGSAALETEIVKGGAEGDSSVTIEVEVTGGNIAGDTVLANNWAPTGAIPSIEFEVPMLQATSAVLHANPNTGAPVAVGVGITSTIAVRRARSNPFPNRIQGADADGSRESGSESVGTKVDAIGYMQSQVYNTMMPGLAFNWVAPFSTVEDVDVRKRQEIIALGAGDKDPSVKDPKEAGPALRIGLINIVAPLNPPRDLGGEDPTVTTTESDGTALPAEDYEVGDGLSGDAVVMVSGNFQSGDKIYLGTKPMSIDGGMAMGSVDIEALLQSAKGLKVLYVPGGVDNLKPGGFYGTAKLDFDDSDNRSLSAGPRMVPAPQVSAGMLQYRGFSRQGYAYGVVRAGGTDSSHVRVTCESGGPCVIFADCTDQSGMNYFGGPVSIGAGETGVVSSDEIAVALGGGWESGRGRCDLVSNGPLSVQHMVRSGHSLINNSVVVNKAVAPFPTIPGPATYTCVPADGNDDGTEITSADADNQTCSPKQQ